MVKYKKDGGLDLRSKGGKQMQAQVNFWTSSMGGCFIRLIIIVIILLVLGEIFLSFGEWLKSLE